MLCPKIRETSTVPIVVVSIRKRREDYLHALKIGADDFIVRPFDPELFVARVAALLRRVYRYDAKDERPTTISQAGQPAMPVPPTVSMQSSIPSDWVTCDACSYMGPGRRFDRIDKLGQRSMICPHCNQAQNLTFTLG